MRLSSSPYTQHAPPISFSILSPELYWVSSTRSLSSSLCSFLHSRHLVPPMPKYSPQHPTLNHPQAEFLPQCQRPNNTTNTYDNIKTVKALMTNFQSPVTTEGRSASSSCGEDQLVTWLLLPSALGRPLWPDRRLKSRCIYFFYQKHSDFRNNTAFWKVTRLRPSVLLVRATRRWRWGWSWMEWYWRDAT